MSYLCYCIICKVNMELFLYLVIINNNYYVIWNFFFEIKLYNYGNFYANYFRYDFGLEKFNL